MSYPARLFAILLLTMPAACWAQAGRLQLPDFSALAKRATKSVVVSINGDMLKAATGLTNSVAGPGANAAAKAAIQGLKGVYVRSFTFAHAHEYSRADVDAVLRQLHGPGWTPMVSVHSSTPRRDVDIYMLHQNGRTRGMVIVAAQPRTLTIVNLVGDMNLAGLAQLRGRFGVPNVSPSPTSGSRSAHAAAKAGAAK